MDEQIVMLDDQNNRLSKVSQDSFLHAGLDVTNNEGSNCSVTMGANLIGIARGNCI